MKKTVDEILEHHGVKGQKWGVRKAEVSGSSSGSAQAKVSSSPTNARAAAGEAKAKQILVDHAYAKRSAQIAGLSVAGIAAAALAPGLLPAAVVATAGGTTVLSAKVALAATVATRAAYVQNYLSYAKRAKARVAHADGPSDPTVEQVYNALALKQKLSAHLLIEDTANGVEFADDPEVQDGWASMTPTERSVVLFMASGIAKSEPIRHAEINESQTEGGSVMNTTTAIMALPAPLDGIRLVGDEEKHATLLFFGETSTLPDGAKDVLTESVKMATSMLFPFSEAIRDVSRLGSENPPALVAMLTDRNLSQIRNLFMMNPSVQGYLDNVQQHPSFTPHVTLGHPDFSEEVILRTLAKQLFRVNFDRLAVWWNDERIEYPLAEMVEGDTMAMSEAVNKFLAHHGIKGQKWGVRRPVGSSGLVSRVVGKKASSEPVSTGLKPRTGSADQIAQDRIQKKIDTNGIHSLSNTELQSYTRRLQLEKDVNKALSEQSVATKAKTDGFIKRFIKNQGSRQIDRVVNKALDVAMEQAVLATGLKLHKSSKHFDPEEKLPSNLDAGKALMEVSKRMAPKKGK